MKVAVIYGGSSAEKEVSISTGEAVLKACLENNFNASPVIINMKTVKNNAHIWDTHLSSLRCFFRNHLL